MKSLASLIIALVAMGAIATSSWAGFEPSPFQPEINQLGAVENGLNSCLDRISKVLGCPPDDQEPSPNLNGAVNRLEAIDGQMNSLNDFIANTILSVMGVEPSPFYGDVVTALENVRGANDKIMSSVDAFLATPPDDQHSDFISAVENVYGSADMLDYTIETSISQLSGGFTPCVSDEDCGCSGELLACESFTTETDCGAEFGCSWYTNDLTGAYCGPNDAHIFTQCPDLSFDQCNQRSDCYNMTCVDGICQ